MDAHHPPGADDELELVAARPAAVTFPHPILFVHGAYVGAWCWAEYFLPHFAEAGFESYALSLRGHGKSPGRGSLSWHSIADYVHDLSATLARIGRQAVVVGHSMGAFVVQKYLEHHRLPGAALLAPVPPQGLGAPSVELAMREPSLFTEVNAIMQYGRASPAALQRAMFAQPMDATRLADYHQRCQRESQRAIWDMAMFNPVQVWRVNRVPLLYLAAEQDRLIPLHYQTAGAALLGHPLHVADGVGHGLMLETGWRRVADRVIDWLRGTFGSSDAAHER
jgi:non-heme chloroperoxidase